MPSPSACARSTCSYCCRPFTEEDPGVFVESSVYLLPLTVADGDASKPNCAAVQLAPNVVLCGDCRRQFGYDDAHGEKGVQSSCAAIQKEGQEANSRVERRGRSVGAQTEGSKMGNWAFAMAYKGTWHLFKKSGAWQHWRRARGISTGRQEDFLRLFADGGGFLSDDAAVKSVRQTFSADDRKEIMRLVKPVVSRLRRIIRDNLGISGDVDPLPRDKSTRGWRALIQIGYAMETDGGRLEFKSSEQLSTDESLDIRR